MFFSKLTQPASIRRAGSLFSLVFGLAAPSAHAQTGLLNDTGQTQCYNGRSMVSCGHSSVDDASALPRQDGRYGRDAAYAAGRLTKVGGGTAGFDFTRICWNGSPEGSASSSNPCTGTLVPNTTGTASSSPAIDWACTRDNVTGLFWSLQSQSTTGTAAVDARFANTGHNSPARCGFSSGWRVPTLRELLGIVHYGYTSGRAAIDTVYFPGTQASEYWSIDVDAQYQNQKVLWVVSFGNVRTSTYSGSVTGFVRLVRSGP